MTLEHIINAVRRHEMRLVIKEGHVQSRHDHQTHYIGPMELISLYGVQDLRVTFYPSARHEFYGWKSLPADILLTPRSDGDYSLVSAYKRCMAVAYKPPSI